MEVINNYEDHDNTDVSIKCNNCSRRKWYMLGYEDTVKEDGVSEEFLEDCRRTAQKYKKDNDGLIPVDERLPEEPKENPVFDDNPLELYLVDMGGSYPLRAFWNGKEFTDGWSVLKVTAWMPLPEPYRPERNDK